MSNRYRKILLPLDGSPLAEHVLPHVAWLAAPKATELVLVNAIEFWRYAQAGSEFVWSDILTSLRSDAEAYLATQCQQLQQAGYRVTTHILEGDAAQVILDLAQTTDADLIAMSTHGRAGFLRWTLGSVAERVIHGAQIPIFLVREAIKPQVGQLRTILLRSMARPWLNRQYRRHWRWRGPMMHTSFCSRSFSAWMKAASGSSLRMKRP
jgi:nucleotide-binding universal stress UspA family protein